VVYTLNMLAARHDTYSNNLGPDLFPRRPRCPAPDPTRRSGASVRITRNLRGPCRAGCPPAEAGPLCLNPARYGRCT